MSFSPTVGWPFAIASAVSGCCAIVFHRQRKEFPLKGRHPFLVTVYNIVMTALAAALAINELGTQFGCYAFYSMILVSITMGLLTLLLRTAILLFQFAITQFVVSMEHGINTNNLPSPQNGHIGTPNNHNNNNPRFTSNAADFNIRFSANGKSPNGVGATNSPAPPRHSLATTESQVSLGGITNNNGNPQNHVNDNIGLHSSSGVGPSSRRPSITGTEWFIRHRHWIRQSFLAKIITIATVLLVVFLALVAIPWDSSVTCAPWFRTTMISSTIAVVFVQGVLLFVVACLLRRYKGEDGFFIKSGTPFALVVLLHSLISQL